MTFHIVLNLVQAICRAVTWILVPYFLIAGNPVAAQTMLLILIASYVSDKKCTPK